MELNLRKRNSISLYLLFLVMGPLGAIEPHRYTVDELELMAKNKLWNQLVLFLHDVAPAERKLQWQSLVERSAIGYLTQLKDSGVSGVENIGQDLLREYPTLSGSEKFGALADSIFMEGFQRCYQSKEDSPECSKRLLSLLNENTISGNFRLKGAQLLIEHSPQTLKAVCEILHTKNDMRASMVAKCNAVK